MNILQTSLLTFLLFSSTLFAETTVNFKNTCAASNNEQEIILHNIDYSTTDTGALKVWAKFKLDINTLSLNFVEAGVEENTNTSLPTELKQIVLDTSGEKREHGMLIFSTGSYSTDWNNFDIALEPWCQDEVAMCGNYVDIGTKSLSNVTSSDIPTTGLDNTPSSYCNNMILNHTYINKNIDNSHTAFLISSHEKVGDWNSWCDHKVTIDYVTIN